MAPTGQRGCTKSGDESVLTVLSVAYPFAAVSLDTAGGAEQILALLDRGLMAAGHRSVVIAAEGSRVEGELVAVPAPQHSLEEPALESTYQLWMDALCKVLRSHAVDLVH